MQIFVAHGPNQQLFVRELIKRFPASISFRMEEEVAGEEEGYRGIDQALADGFAAFLLIVDEQAATSHWLDGAVKRLMASERQDRRLLLISVALSQRACEELSGKVGSHRDQVKCYDQQDRSIDQAARDVTNAVVAWLSRTYIESSSATAGAGAYASAEATIVNAARVLKAAIYPYRQTSPGTVSEVFGRVSQDAPNVFANENELQRALSDLTRQGRMDGYYFDGELAFLVKERFHDKTSMNVALKQRLAKAAARLVSDDQAIAFDGGTTTLAVARELCAQLTAGSLFGLRVFTNSLPVAHAFLEALALKNAGGRDAACKVELLGGPCRVSTLCTTADEKRTAALAQKIDGVDIGFIGASGLVGTEGFGVTNAPEIAAKAAFQKASSRAVVVCDHTKFDVKQRRLTNPAASGMTIVTDKASADRIEFLRSANPTWREVEVIYCD